MWLDCEVTGRAIAELVPQQWQDEQLESLMQFLGAALSEWIDDEDGHCIDEWLCMIGRAGLKLAPFLEQVANSQAAVLAYYARNASALTKGRLNNAFWQDAKEAESEILSWFKCEAVAQTIEVSYGLRP